MAANRRAAGAGGGVITGAPRKLLTRKRTRAAADIVGGQEEKTRVAKRHKSTATAAQQVPAAAPATRSAKFKADTASAAQQPAPPSQETGLLEDWGLEDLLVLGTTSPARRATPSLFDEATPLLPASLCGTPLPSPTCLTLSATALVNRGIFADMDVANGDSRCDGTLHLRPATTVATTAALAIATASTAIAVSSISVVQPIRIQLHGLAPLCAGPVGRQQLGPADCPTSRPVRERREAPRPADFDWSGVGVEGPAESGSNSNGEAESADATQSTRGRPATGPKPGSQSCQSHRRSRDMRTDSMHTGGGGRGTKSTLFVNFNGISSTKKGGTEGPAVATRGRTAAMAKKSAPPKHHPRIRALRATGDGSRSSRGGRRSSTGSSGSSQSARTGSRRGQ